MSDPLELPFDQYQRYRLVADLVGRVRGARGPLAVLDVGGRTAILRDFLPEDRVQLVDVEASEQAGLVLGDGSALPFKDGAFDVVAAFDTLEHVPPARRAAFVAECARVCRGHVMIAGPYRTPEVDEAEELLRSFLVGKLDLRHRYLEEHRAHGLPVRAEVEAQLAALGARVASFGHGNLERWVALMCTEMYLDHDPKLRPLARRFFRFYNGALYPSDHAPPVYRHVVVAALGGAEPPSAAGLLDDPPAAPAGALERLSEFGVELLAFDREQDVWRPELERLEGVIAGLEADLAGHRSRLSDTQEDLAEHERTLADLRADFDRAQAEHLEERATLEADLGEHAETLSALRADYERAAREAETQRAELEAEVRGRDAVLAEVRAELDAHRGEAGRLGEYSRELEGRLNASNVVLGHKQTELDLAHADLRDRWRSLKRALGPRRPPPAAPPAP